MLVGNGPTGHAWVVAAHSCFATQLAGDCLCLYACQLLLRAHLVAGVAALALEGAPGGPQGNQPLQQQQGQRAPTGD